MISLAILERELRIAARNRRTYRWRFLTGLGALAVGMYFVWVITATMGGAVAGVLTLKAISYLALALCLFAGANRTCDCISSEKREETLGLLFLTRLRAGDVVLGKLLVAWLHTGLLLIGTVPILSVPVVLGGVHGSELVRIPVTLFTALALALSVGILISALATRQRIALMVAGGTMFFLVAGLPALAYSANRDLYSPTLARLLVLPSPAYAQEMSFSTTFGLRENFFWTSIAAQWGISVAAIATACLILPRVWRGPAGRARTVGWNERFNRWRQGTPAERQSRRARLLERNPIFWLSARDRFGPAWPALFAIVVLLAAAYCIVHYRTPREPAFALIFAAFVVIDLSVRAEAGRIASARWVEDRQIGALEMILSTPLTVREILSGQWKAIRHKLLWTYIPLLVSFLVVSAVFLEIMNGGRGNLRIAIFFVMMCLGDFMAIGYVGMWQGMRVTNAANAPAAALFRVLLVPWLIWVGFLPLLDQFPRFRQFLESSEPYGVLYCALGIWLLSSGSALYRARRNLLDHFREAATDRYAFERRRGIWARARESIAAFIALERSRKLARPPTLSPSGGSGTLGQ